MDIKPRILYVEDDMTLGFITSENLERQGYEIIHCTDGARALQIFHQQLFDLCILDVMLPNMDGFSLAKNIRMSDTEIPILFVTAKSLQEDKIEGLMLGADDYIVKPFSIQELSLRIEVFLKRSNVRSSGKDQDAEQCIIGQYRLDLQKLLLIRGEIQEKLTFREAELIHFFYRNQGKLLSREQILQAVWGENDYFSGRSLDVFISRLRKYMKEDSSISIENRHGIGFIFHCK